MVGGNSLEAISSPLAINSLTLASLFEVENDVLLMQKICWCESFDDPKALNESSGALGRCQMIPQTRNYVERKWGIEIDWENPDEQLYACQRLLNEEGTKHWAQTEFCWNK